VQDKLGKLACSLVFCAVAGGAVCGCSRREPVEEGRTAPPPRGAVVEFPAALQPDDPSVGAFIQHVVDTCVAGDYDAFRLLWSAREDPFSRDAFERGWRAVQRVTLVHVQKFRRREEGDIVYGVHARVELDDSVPESQREVVLLIVREGDQWRLVRPPTGLHEQLTGTPETLLDDDTEEAAQPASQPAEPVDRVTNLEEPARP